MQSNFLLVFTALAVLFAGLEPVRAASGLPLKQLAPSITTELSFDSQPRYSPDGTHIVFVSDRSGDDNLWIVNADGSAPRQLSLRRGDAPPMSIV